MARQFSGVLNVYKPPGPSSHQVVSRARKCFGQRKVGHAGTLDPAACGVLLLLFGTGTRIAEPLMELPKVYRARLRLGIATDSEDATGQVTRTAPVPQWRPEQVQAVLSSFCGARQQTPPAYSALKYRGERLYALARRGVSVPRHPRPIFIYGLDFLGGESTSMEFRVTCSRGTYVRSLGVELAAALGTVGHVEFLEREAVGWFHKEAAIGLEEFESLARHEAWADRLTSLAEALSFLPAIVVNAEGERALAHGGSLDRTHVLAVRGGAGLPSLATAGDEARQTGHLRALNTRGLLLALGRFTPRDSVIFRPEKVLLETGIAETNALSAARAGLPSAGEAAERLGR